MSIRTRIHRISKIKTQSAVTKPFQDSVIDIILGKCHKLQHQLHKDGKITQQIQTLISALDKDIQLLNPKNISYYRLMSLVYNTKATYYHKINDDEQALLYLDQALELEKIGDVDSIDVARTLLNRSIIMGQLAKGTNLKQQNVSNQKRETLKNNKTEAVQIKQSDITYKQQPRQIINSRQQKKTVNLYSHEAALQLVKKAIQIIKDRGTSKCFVQQGENKLGEIIIISFHNIATELITLQNQKQAHALYRKAYDLAIKVLGSKHSLTKHLRNIVVSIITQSNKSNKCRIRVMTDMCERGITNNNNSNNNNNNDEDQINYSSHKSHHCNQSLNKLKVKNNENLLKNSLKKHKNNNNSHSKNNIYIHNNQQNSKRYKSFFKIYGYDQGIKNDKSMRISADGSYTDDKLTDMKDLKKLQRLYGEKVQTSSTSNYSNFPVIRKNIKDIIKQGKTVAELKPEYKIQRQKTNPQNIPKNQINETNYIQEILSNKQIKISNSDKNVKIIQKQQKKTKIENQEQLNDKGNCQLI